MVKTYRKLRIFLASPDDLRRDREHIRRIVEQINREISDESGLILQTMDWRDVAPGMGRPEAVILDQLPVAEWDLFIGIIWHRFGTSTGGIVPSSNRSFGSGTEEEFDLAYAAWKQSGRPKIMFYRCVRKVRPDMLDPKQARRVKKFFAQFAPRGETPGLVAQYATAKELESQVRLHLMRHVQKAMEPPAIEPARTMFKGREYLFIPSGPFIMGAHTHQADPPIPRQSPAHTVNLEAYHVSRFPVTNAEYQEFIDDTGHPLPYRNDELSRPYNWNRKTRTHPEGKGDHPVVLVSWHDAQAYCRWQHVRLPTEAEWEKAARGVEGRQWPWGDTWRAGLCNAEGSGLSGPSTVGQFSPQGDSPFGISDMAGNVWEWCSSLPFPYPYRSDDGREASASSGKRILRGGSFGADREWVRCHLRNSADPSDYGFNIGFRVVLQTAKSGSG